MSHGRSAMGTILEKQGAESGLAKEHSGVQGIIQSNGVLAA